MIWANDSELEILLATLDEDKSNAVIQNRTCNYISESGEWGIESTPTQHQIHLADGLVFYYDAISFNRSYIRLYQLHNDDNYVYISRSKRCPF